ncbi:MAG: hypothetical protein R3D26_19695 [Cyanobacteriota/Melainabacteria group bacterium]
MAENRLTLKQVGTWRLTYLFPDSFNTYLAWGLLFREQDNLAKAEENLAKAVALNPDSAYAWNQLALVRENRADPKGRAEALKSASSARDQSYEISIYPPDFEHYGKPQTRSRVDGRGQGHDHGNRHRERREHRRMPSAVELLQED